MCTTVAFFLLLGVFNVICLGGLVVTVIKFYSRTKCEAGSQTDALLSTIVISPSGEIEVGCQ